MTTPNPRNLLTGTTPGPWSDQWSQLEPCVVALVGYTKIDGYNHPQERAADIAQKDKDRALAAAAPDLAARVIALEDEIRALHRPVDIEPSDTICSECSWQHRAGRFFGKVVAYPCPTIALLDEEAGA